MRRPAARGTPDVLRPSDLLGSRPERPGTRSSMVRTGQHGDVATDDDHPADGGGLDPEPDRRSARGERRRASSWTSPRTVSDTTAL
jgi:hypothetical protein